MVALSLFSKIGQVGFQAGGYLCSEIQKNMEQRPATTEEYQRKVNILVEYINNHLSETIDLDILAEMSGFSPWHFHRIVKAFLGENIGAFIVRMRVETENRAGVRRTAPILLRIVFIIQSLNFGLLEILGCVAIR